MESVSWKGRLIQFFSSCLGYLRFTHRRMMEREQYGKYEFRYQELLNGRKVYVLANGPSLKEDIANLITSDVFVNSEKFVLNFFAISDYYSQIKPAFYCLADKGFFIDGYSEGHAQTLKAIDCATDWEMHLYVPNMYFNYASNAIKNPKITIVPVSTLLFSGFEEKKYSYYMKGIAVPSYVNVVIMIEYLLLNMGCKDIWLYGVDHTFFTNMAVNDENHVGYSEKHFYGEDFVELKNYDGGYLKISEWLMDKYLTFKEHENMRGYADYLGARIVNCTKNSLIDSYIRLSQIDKEEKQ